MEAYISKEQIDKQFIHLTNRGKNLWIFEPVLSYLDFVNRVFFETSTKFQKLNEIRNIREAEKSTD